MKRRFLICFPYEGDVEKINRIADALDNEGIDFVQVNESFTDGTPDTTIARGDIEEVKREIKEEVVEERVVEKMVLKKVFKDDDFVYGYEPGMNRWLPYIIKEVLGDDRYLVYNYQVGAPYQTEDEVFEMDGEDLRKQPEDRTFLVQDYLYANDGKNFEDYVKDNSKLIKDIYVDNMSGTVDIEWNDPTMKGYITQATPFWMEEELVPVQVSTEDGDIIDTGARGFGVYFEEYDDLNFPNSIYPNSPSSFYQAYVDILPDILQQSKKQVEMYEKRKFEKGGSIKGKKAREFLRTQGFEFASVDDEGVIETANELGYKYDENKKEWTFAKGGEISKDNKALITGGLAGILLGIFLNK